jgi:hypothetical protein
LPLLTASGAGAASRYESQRAKEIALAPKEADLTSRERRRISG